MTASRLSRQLVESRSMARLFGALERVAPRRQGELRVLTYHHVPAPSVFAAHLDYLTTRMVVVSPDAVVQALAADQRLPPGAVLLTFDDGYRDFKDQAWPVLRQRGLTAALFVPTAFAADPSLAFWWDRLQAAVTQTARRDAVDTPVGRLRLDSAGARRAAFRCMRDYVKTLPHDTAMRWVNQVCASLGATEVAGDVLGWDELRQLAKDGVAVAPHTRTHALLDRVPAERVRDEVLGSLADIRRELGAASPLFAYPGGRYTPQAVALLAHAGVTAAFTTVPGTNVLAHSDRLRLRRINVSSVAGRGVLRARMLQAAPAFNRWYPVPVGHGHTGNQGLRERLRSQVLYRSLDAVITAPQRRGTLRGYCAAVVRPASHAYDRVGALAGLAHRVAPRGMARWTARLCRADVLPLLGTFEVLGYGSGMTVWEAGDIVVKINRRSLGRRLEGVLEIGRELKALYETYRVWFGDALVWPTRYLIVHAPLLGTPAVALVQRRITVKSDLLAERSDAEIVQLLRRSPALHANFVRFATTTLTLAAEDGLFPDVLGRENLCLIETEQGNELRLIDYRWLPMVKYRTNAKVAARVAACLARLRSLLALLGENGCRP